jgi:NAD-dependent SIR2 family protein deacetylase
MIKGIYRRLVPERQRLHLRLNLNKMTSIYYRGSYFYCNCCRRSFRKFKSKGNTLVQRANAECPYCGSLERVRNLLFYIDNETDLLTRSNEPQ